MSSRILLITAITYIMGFASLPPEPPKIDIHPNSIQIQKEFTKQYASLNQTQKDNIIHLVPDYIEHTLDKGRDYRQLYQIRFWCAFNNLKCKSILQIRLNDTTTVGLENIYDLNIPIRVKTGDMKNDPYGKIVEFDLFKVNGRAQWILDECFGLKIKE